MPRSPNHGQNNPTRRDGPASQDQHLLSPTRFLVPSQLFSLTMTTLDPPPKPYVLNRLVTRTTSSVPAGRSWSTRPYSLLQGVGECAFCTACKPRWPR